HDARGDRLAAHELHVDLVHRVDDVGRGHHLAVARDQDTGADLVEVDEPRRARRDLASFRADDDDRGADLAKELAHVLRADGRWEHERHEDDQREKDRRHRSGPPGGYLMSRAEGPAHDPVATTSAGRNGVRLTGSSLIPSVSPAATNARSDAEMN